MECLVRSRHLSLGHLTLSCTCVTRVAASQRFRPCQSSLTQVRRKHIARPGEQANSIAGYYEALLGSSSAISHPAQSVRSSKITSTETKSQKAERNREEVEAKARLVFGDPYAGPLAQKLAKERRSTNIAGIMVPPRPDEPDNCCMSGCVNCVWDLYREDLEEWAAKAAEAQSRLQVQGKQNSADAQRLRTFSGGATKDTGLPGGAPSMDDDGGGSESNWSFDAEHAGPPKPGQDLFATIPVGIRQFMQTEKALKERHIKEARTGRSYELRSRHLSSSQI